MRQRTITDYFWRDPEISELSQEDKATLLYLLTSPSSNIIGVYQVVWRIAAAEMGWTADQLLTVITRLKNLGLVEFNKQGFIWVKTWWKHNSAIGAFSPKLLAKAKKQCDEMPSEWLEGFLDLLDKAGKGRVTIGYPYPIDWVTPNTNTNTNTNTNNNDDHDIIGLSFPEATTASKRPKQPVPLVSQESIEALILPDQLSVKERELALRHLGPFSLEIAQEILDELTDRLNSNSVRGPSISYLRALVERAKVGTFTPEAGIRVAHRRKRDKELTTTRNLNSQAETPLISTNAFAHLDTLRKILSSPEMAKSNDC